jgi:hypothetical protein
MTLDQAFTTVGSKAVLEGLIDRALSTGPSISQRLTLAAEWFRECDETHVECQVTSTTTNYCQVAFLTFGALLGETI